MIFLLIMKLYILHFAWKSAWVVSFVPKAMNLSTPVVFVVFGDLPLHVYMNVELVSRKNHVIIVSDSVRNKKSLLSPSSHEVVFEPMDRYNDLARKFSGVYRHFCKDRSVKRKFHEMQCIQRWLILCEYMQRRSSEISSTYFSDGDSYLFVSAQDAFKERKCDAGKILH